MKNEKNDQLEVDESRRTVLTAALLAAPTAMLAGCVGGRGGSDDLVETETSALTVAELQARCNSFYAMSNVVELRISMPASEWDALRLEEPAGGRCNSDYVPPPDRYVWRHATSVTISGSAMPAASTFTDVGIKKKSHCGSFDTDRPCFKLDFSEFTDHKSELEALIGTSHLLLNNSVQDDSYVRTPLAFFLFKQAGLPASRCNFCKVFVNNNLIAVYLNVEPIKQRFIENNFSPTRKGNLYEFEAGDDFLISRIPKIDLESVSAITNRVDLGIAATEVAKGVSGMSKVIDVPQYIKFLAMECLIKDVDSFDSGVFSFGNNTYVYNDVQAVANPTADGGNVRFKLIPSGPDYVLRPEFNFGIKDPARASRLCNLVLNDATLLAQLRTQIGVYGDSVFSRANMTNVINPFIDQMQAILTSLGAASKNFTPADLPRLVTEVRGQLRLVRSAAWLLGGLPSTASLYFKDPTTGDNMRASASQHVGQSTTDWEVVHRAPVEDANDRWFMNGSIRNEGNGGFLYASPHLLTPAGHAAVYTTPFTDGGLGSEDFIPQVDQISSFCVSGLLTIRNRRTGLYLKFGMDDPTAGTGAQRVYQAGLANATKLSVY